MDCTLLAVACLITYLLVTRLLSRLYFVSKADDILGGMWAVIATIFVNRHSYQQSLAAAASRMAATSVSFIICLIYLLFLPFHSWALAVLIGVSALAVTLFGHAEDAITAAITTAVVMVVAEVSPAPRLATAHPPFCRHCHRRGRRHRSGLDRPARDPPSDGASRLNTLRPSGVMKLQFDDQWLAGRSPAVRATP